MTPLELAEQKRLQELEGIIEHGLASFMTTGVALLEIREDKLYRDDYGTFKEYCDKRWGMTDRNAQYIMNATKFRKELETRRGLRVLPSNVDQTVPLTRLKTKEQRAKAWKNAVQASGNGRPSAPVVAAAVAEIQEPRASGNGGPLDPTLEVAWILEFLSAWTKKIGEFENATKVGKFSPEAQRFVARRIDAHIVRLNQWKEILDA